MELTRTRQRVRVTLELILSEILKDCRLRLLLVHEWIELLLWLLVKEWRLLRLRLIRRRLELLRLLLVLLRIIKWLLRLLRWAWLGRA